MTTPTPCPVCLEVDGFHDRDFHDRQRGSKIVPTRITDLPTPPDIDVTEAWSRYLRRNVINLEPL